MASSWERLATASSSSASTITTSAFTPKKHLKIIVESTGGSSSDLEMQFGTGGSIVTSGYTQRRTKAYPNSADTTNTSQSRLRIGDGSYSLTDYYFVGSIINIDGYEKQVIGHGINNNTGNDQVPNSYELAGKWTTTSGQINIIKVGSIGDGATLTGLKITVYGADDQTITAKDKSSITNVPAGTRYEETDTRKIFRRKAGGDPQVDDVFNSTWDVSDSGASFNEATDAGGGSATVNFGAGESPRSVAFGTTTAWNSKTFLIKFTWQGKSGSRGNNTAIHFGSDDWQDDNPPTSGKRLHMRMVNFNSQRVGVHVGGSNISEQTLSPTHYGDRSSGGLSGDDTKYYLIEGNGTNVVGSYYSTKSNRDAKTNAIATTSATTFPSDWLDKDPIDTISLGEWSGYYKGHTIISDISIKVDNGTEDSWVEKGTA